MNPWRHKIQTDWTEKNLTALLNNEVGLLVLKNFLSAAACLDIINYLKTEKVIQKYDYNFAEAAAPEALHYMTTHYLFEEDSDPSNYLKEARDSAEKYHKLVKGSGTDPLEMIETQMANIGFETIIATENTSPYSRAMIRSLSEGALLHADYAPFLEQDWSIKSIDAELAWNIFLESPEGGGECVVHNRPWQLADDKFKLPDSYGYREDLIENCEQIDCTPQLGDLVLFNARNFHEVRKSSGNRDRITMGGHFGRRLEAKNSLLSWI